MSVICPHKGLPSRRPSLPQSHPLVCITRHRTDSPSLGNLEGSPDEVHCSVNVSCMILRRRWQVSAGLVWSGLRVGEGRETHLAARRRHSCAMPRRSAALAGRRRAGSSAACRPRVLRRPMQAPTPLGSRRRSGSRLGQAAGVSGWGVSRLSSSPRLNFVLPRSGCSSRRRLPASLARCRRCRRRVPPRAVAERSVAGAGGSRRRPRRGRAYRAGSAVACVVGEAGPCVLPWSRLRLSVGAHFGVAIILLPWGRGRRPGRRPG